MTLHITITGPIHVHAEDPAVTAALHAMREKLDKLLHTTEKIMSAADEIKTALAAVDAETTAVGTRIDALIARLQTNTITDTEKADILAGLSAEAARLKTLAVDPNAPVPPVPATLATARSK